MTSSVTVLTATKDHVRALRSAPRATPELVINAASFLLGRYVADQQLLGKLEIVMNPRAKKTAFSFKADRWPHYTSTKLSFSLDRLEAAKDGEAAYKQIVCEAVAHVALWPQKYVRLSLEHGSILRALYRCAE